MHQELLQEYSDQPLLIEYLQHIKYPKRHQWAKPWTSQVRHFGNEATSRLEGGHHHLKSWLNGNQGDLLELKDKIKASFDVFKTNFERDAATKRDRPSHQFHAKRWPKLLDQNLNYQVTPEAMEKLVGQLYIMADRMVNRPCSGAFEKVFHIPCYHTLRAYEAHNRKVTKDDFDVHWHFKRDLPPPPPASPEPVIFAPHVVRTRGRPREDTSTWRDLSQFKLGAARSRPGRVGGAVTTAS